MRLIADRFVVEQDDLTFDLATGARVLVRIGAAGDRAEHARWTLRCDALHALHHPALAPLVDYGLLGRTERFEAWRCGGAWSGAKAEASRASDRVFGFLSGCGLTPGLGATDAVHAGPAGPVVVPDASAGYPAEEAPAADRLEWDVRGLTIVPRPAVAALAEMFRADGARPHVSELWGPRGSGKSTAIRLLSRLARVNGFIPIAAHVIGSRYRDLWMGRSVFIVERNAAGTAWSALLQAATPSSPPHALLLVGTEEHRTVESIAMNRIAADVLVGAVRPSVTDPRTEARIRRAAEESRGWPGRFAQQLWPTVAALSRRPSPPTVAAGGGSWGRRQASRVAEQVAAYGSPERLEDAQARSAAAAWPAPGELATLRRRMDAAIAQLVQGCHEPAIRAVRETAGALARRHEWTDATRGALALATSLLRRGRANDAHKSLDDARVYAGRSDQPHALADIAILAGEASIDLGRLDDAEGTLAAALAAARAAADPARAAAASLALARVLFWRGRYADAASSLDGVAPEPHTPLAARVRHAGLAARIAVGQREFSQAMALAARGVTLAASDDDRRARAVAHTAAAFVHLAIDDMEAVDRHVALAVADARSGRDPLYAIRAQLLHAESWRRRGRPSPLGHLARLASSAAPVPPTLRVRCALIADLVASKDASAVVSRHVRATGLGALALYVPDGDARRCAPAGDGLVEELVAILRVCQTADDDVAVMKHVCGRVRQQLHAAAIACIAVAGAASDVVAFDGSRVDHTIAERTAASGITIAPHRVDDRIEAAAPVQYGGVPIGAVAARWTFGSTYDRSRAAAVLTMTATAVAPMLAAAIARRSRAAAPGLVELVGVTQAIADVRQAADRASSAPFAVLIVGESGCGKELVARAVHRAGPRRDRPLCTLNCAALPDDLIEAELFGHARGAFTGAIGERAGVFEEAHGGTLFLDEVGELSARAQAKLLRVIQEGEVRRIGENVTRRVDVRVVSATNRDLRQEVAAGRFRLDLLYRLDVIRIAVPPLRERREDIALLAEQFWRDATARVGSRATLAPATLAALARYDWPGNVRELQNVLASLAVRSPRRGAVPPSALPPQFGETAASDIWRLDTARRTFEEQFVRAALVRSGGHRARAAEELGVSRQGLNKLMVRLGISEQ